MSSGTRFSSTFLNPGSHLKDKSLSASRTSLCLGWSKGNLLSAARASLGAKSLTSLRVVCLKDKPCVENVVWDAFSFTFPPPRWCRGDAENVVWDMFSFNSLQPQSPRSCRGDVENVVWDMFSFNFLQLSSTPGGAENVVWDMFSFNFLQLSSTFLTPGWRGECRLGIPFLCIKDKSINSLQPHFNPSHPGRVEVAQRVSSGTRFPSTLFNPT